MDWNSIKAIVAISYLILWKFEIVSRVITTKRNNKWKKKQKTKDIIPI